MRLFSIVSLLWACNDAPKSDADADKDGYTVDAGDCDDNDDTIGLRHPIP